MNENELITLAKQGDLDAFNQIVLTHQDAAYGYACSILFDHHAAEDCTQEAFIKAYIHLQEHRGNTFRSWIMKIVRNVCIDELRRTKHQKFFPLVFKNQYGEEEEREDLLVDPGKSVEEKFEQGELRSILARYLDAVPDKYRSVLVMVDVLGMAYVEAAVALNIPVGTLKSRLARGRFHLSRMSQDKRQFLEAFVAV